MRKALLYLNLISGSLMTLKSDILNVLNASAWIDLEQKPTSR
jgi:hypothetical protein